MDRVWVCILAIMRHVGHVGAVHPVETENARSQNSRTTHVLSPLVQSPLTRPAFYKRNTAATSKEHAPLLMCLLLLLLLLPLLVSSDYGQNAWDCEHDDFLVKTRKGQSIGSVRAAPSSQSTLSSSFLETGSCAFQWL